MPSSQTVFRQVPCTFSQLLLPMSQMSPRLPECSWLPLPIPSKITVLTADTGCAAAAACRAG